MATDNLTTTSKTICIDRGDEEYIFVDKYGEEFCKIRFNPADSGIAKRYRDVLEKIENYKQLEETEQDADSIIKADEFLKEQFSYLIGRENAGGVFDTISPLAVLADGRFFFKAMMETIGGIISDEIDKRYEKVREKIQNAADDILGNN